MLAVLGVILVPLSLGILFMGVRSGIKTVPVALGIILLITFAAVVLLYLKGRGKSVTSFTESGLSRNDGKVFLWSNLRRVVDKMANRSATRKGLWRTEIQFSDGSSAWIIPSKIANYDEVRAFVRGLNCEHAQEDA